MVEIGASGEVGAAEDALLDVPTAGPCVRPVEVGSRCPRLPAREDGMLDAMKLLRGGLASASSAMRTALADIGREEMAIRPTGGTRSLESLLGEATMALRDALAAIGRDELPKVPAGFEARFARWGMGAGPDGDAIDMISVFSGHVMALDRAAEDFGPADLDATVDPAGCFDEDGLLSFETVGEVVFSVSGFIHLLAGEARVIRLALGKPAPPDPFDDR